jgi:hypothetical protein
MYIGAEKERVIINETPYLFLPPNSSSLLF